MQAQLETLIIVQAAGQTKTSLKCAFKEDCFDFSEFTVHAGCSTALWAQMGRSPIVFDQSIS